MLILRHVHRKLFLTQTKECHFLLSSVILTVISWPILNLIITSNKGDVKKSLYHFLVLFCIPNFKKSNLTYRSKIFKKKKNMITGSHECKIFFIHVPGKET